MTRLLPRYHVREGLSRSFATSVAFRAIFVEIAGHLYPGEVLDRANLFALGVEYLGTQVEIAIGALSGMAKIFEEGRGIEEHQEMHGRLGKQCSGLCPAVRRGQ